MTEHPQREQCACNCPMNHSGTCTAMCQNRPHTPAPTNTELIRCTKKDCIDYNTELCQPWKCTHTMEKHDTATRNDLIGATVIKAHKGAMVDTLTLVTKGGKTVMMDGYWKAV